MSPNLPAKIQPHPFLPHRVAWVAVVLVSGADCQYLCYTNTNTEERSFKKSHIFFGAEEGDYHLKISLHLNFF